MRTLKFYLWSMRSGIKLFLFLVMTASSASAQYIPKFDLQGHRGARGLKPENTIPAFITALNYGVTTIELDVVITHDNQVILSHEPWMSHEFCLKPDSGEISLEDEKKSAIYKMNYSEVKQYDCGLKMHPRFPEQEKMTAHKPLLTEVIAAVENHIKSFTTYEVDYNIEIKSTKEGDNIFHPTPEVFSDIVYQLIDQYLPWERIVIQSFDFRVLKYWKKKYPHVRLAALVENKNSAEANLSALGFTPSIYSPNFILLTPDVIRMLHQKKIRVIPWTINEVADMKRFKTWGVDGIITDYPNRAAELGIGLKKGGAAKK
jgi:glycerophosphoryl diester phosphodiesterase